VCVSGEGGGGEVRDVDNEKESMWAEGIGIRERERDIGREREIEIGRERERVRETESDHETESRRVNRRLRQHDSLRVCAPQRVPTGGHNVLVVRVHDVRRFGTGQVILRLGGENRG
jgi:hypothetical protein